MNSFRDSITDLARRRLWVKPPSPPEMPPDFDLSQLSQTELTERFLYNGRAVGPDRQGIGE
jgi:hypothetical protein